MPRYTPEVQPLITMEDLQIVETVVRKSEAVIEQCGILGIPKEDMHKVYAILILHRAFDLLTNLAIAILGRLAMMNDLVR